jgi:hypothetical protein
MKKFLYLLIKVIIYDKIKKENKRKINFEEINQIITSPKRENTQKINNENQKEIDDEKEKDRKRLKIKKDSFHKFSFIGKIIFKILSNFILFFLLLF